MILLPIIIPLLLAVPVTGQNTTVVWQGEVVSVSLTPENNTITYGMVTYRILYKNQTALDIFIANIDPKPANITLVLYDYYDSNNNATKTYNVTTYVQDTVTVWSNTTIIEIYNNGEKQGVISVKGQGEETVQFPSEYLSYTVFLPFLMLLGFAGRGNVKESGLGLLVFGFIAPWLSAIGFDAQLMAVTGVVSSALGIVMLVATTLGQGGSIMTGISLTSIGRGVIVFIFLWTIVSGFMTTLLVYIGADVPSVFATRLEKDLAFTIYNAVANQGVLIYIGAIPIIIGLVILGMIKNMIIGLPLLVSQIASMSGNQIILSQVVLQPVAGFLQLTAMYYALSWIRGVVRE